VVVFEVFPRAKLGQFDKEGEGYHFAVQLLHEVYGGTGGAARSEKVVHDDHAITRSHGVAVHLDGVAAIFEVVFGGNRLGGELAQLAHRHEATAKPVSDGRAEDEAATLDGYHFIYLECLQLFSDAVNRLLEGFSVLQEGSNVPKEYTRHREIGYVPNQP